MDTLDGGNRVVDAFVACIVRVLFKQRVLLD